MEPVAMRFAIMHWEEKLSSIIQLKDVTFPRKDITQYCEGDRVIALYQKRPYKARISEISDDKLKLQAKKNKSNQYPIQFSYDSETDEGQSKVTSSTVIQKEEAQQIKIGTSDDLAMDDAVKEVHVELSSMEEDSYLAAGSDDEGNILGTKDNDTSLSKKMKTSRHEDDASKMMKTESYVTVKDFLEVKEDYRKLQRRVRELEKHLKKKSTHQAKQTSIPVEPVLMPIASTPESPSRLIVEPSQPSQPIQPSQPSDFNGFTSEELFDTVSRFDNTYDCVHALLLKLFTPQYLISHSITGQKANTVTMAKPRMDSRLYQVLVNIMKAKFKTIKDTEITAKVQAVQKNTKRSCNNNNIYFY